MLSELAFPHIRCCLSAIPSELMKSIAVDESLSSMNQQFCSRENQLLQMLQQNEKSTQTFFFNFQLQFHWWKQDYQMITNVMYLLQKVETVFCVRFTVNTRSLVFESVVLLPSKHVVFDIHDTGVSFTGLQMKLYCPLLKCYSYFWIWICVSFYVQLCVHV